MPEETPPEVVADLTDQTLAADTAEDVYLGDSESDANNANDVATLRAQLEEALKRADEEHEAFLRARADFANFKRRTEEEKESLRQFLSSDLLLGFLPIVDNFERALAAAAQTEDYEKLVAGVNAVHKQMLDFLNRAGVTPIEALNQPFDPNFHNAVARDESGDAPENTVVEELQRGYLLGSRVLRPTLVKVSGG
jgi:Molecular chaperone GrpE (heat shock protein)